MENLNLILTVIGIVSPFVLVAVWISGLIVKTSNKALLLESKLSEHGKRIDVLEVATSYTSIERVVEKVCLQVLHSKEFKDSMKESLESTIEKSVKDTLLHIEKSKSKGESGAFEEILTEIRRIHLEVIHNNKNEPIS